MLASLRLPISRSSRRWCDRVDVSHREEVRNGRQYLMADPSDAAAGGGAPSGGKGAAGGAAP